MSKTAEGDTGKRVNRAYWLGFVAGFAWRGIFESLRMQRRHRRLDRIIEQDTWRKANEHADRDDAGTADAGGTERPSRSDNPYQSHHPHHDGAFLHPRHPPP